MLHIFSFLLISFFFSLKLYSLPSPFKLLLFFFSFFLPQEWRKQTATATLFIFFYSFPSLEHAFFCVCVLYFSFNTFFFFGFELIIRDVCCVFCSMLLDPAFWLGTKTGMWDILVRGEAWYRNSYQCGVSKKDQIAIVLDLRMIVENALIVRFD